MNSSRREAFKEKVLRITRGIKKGQTMSYKEVAFFTGSPNAYRAVGNILRKNFDPKILCHRVIRSDGSLGEYNRGREKKKEILFSEKFLEN